jgi:hypothetical protein
MASEGRKLPRVGTHVRKLPRVGTHVPSSPSNDATAISIPVELPVVLSVPVLLLFVLDFTVGLPTSYRFQWSQQADLEAGGAKQLGPKGTGFVMDAKCSLRY